jgi:hydroxymethylpyrimidine pyrophosphatase-like HAD family hydrolase
VVFGDNLNDLPMFAEADTSVAVQNAKPEVKEAADCITDDVVAFIEEYTKNGDIE